MTRRSRPLPAPLLVSVVLALLAPLLATSGPATADETSYDARAGKSGCTARAGIEACFTSPPTVTGDPTVLDRPSRLFDTAGAGDTIRIAMFRWDIKPPTDAIIAAQRRGAVVYLVGDDDLRLNKQGRRLISTIEDQDPARTNVTICSGACLPWRAPGPFPDSQNVQHLKFYVTEIGGVQSFITSSANLEDRQYRQYNSFLKIDDPGLYAFGLEYFSRLQAQSLRVDGSTWDDASKEWSKGPITAAVYPSRSDLLLSTLRRISCTRGAREVSAMFAVIQRADVRAELARLSKKGCKVRVLTSRDTVENWMQASLPTGQLPDRAVRTVLTHDKMLAAHARFRGKPTHLVVTGTSNTTCGGLLYNDEVMLRVVDNRWLYQQYLAHFDDAFAHSFEGKSRIMPVMKPCRR
jgi:phosphatidylserine/phosphatidylglycerophosphate/cardiolipin synthase-like enzyme